MRYIHVYSGSSGNAGAYINALIRSGAVVNSSFVIASNYPFETEAKIIKSFFPISDRFGLPRRLRYVIRALEFCWTHVVLCVRVQRGAVVVYHLVNFNGISFMFLRLLQWRKLPFDIVAHDVIEHSGAADHRRDIIFRWSRRVVIHSLQSMPLIARRFGEAAGKKCVYIPFPYSYKGIHVGGSVANDVSGINDYHLLIGVYRKDKGFEKVVNAWQCMGQGQLVVAGNLRDWPGGVRGSTRVSFINRYLTDEDFLDLIKRAKGVLIPYEEYANSGILFSALQLERPVFGIRSALALEILGEHYPLLFNSIEELVRAATLGISVCKSEIEKIKAQHEARLVEGLFRHDW